MDQLGHGVDPERRGLAPLPIRAGPIPCRSHAAGDGIESGVLHHQRSVIEPVCRFHTAGKARCDGISVHGINEHSPAGTNCQAKRSEYGKIVFFAAVSDGRKDIECSIKSVFRQRFPQIVPKIPETVGGQITSILFGLGYQILGLIYPNDGGTPSGDRQREPPVTTGGIKYTTVLMKCQEFPNPLHLPSRFCRPIRPTPDTDVIRIKKRLPPVVHDSLKDSTIQPTHGLRFPEAA